MIRGCDRCDHGWRGVTQAYVDRKAPMPGPLDAAMVDVEGMAEAHELLIAEVTARRAALAGSVYPCKDCLPATFYRWAGGHFDLNHDTAGCPECQEIIGHRRGGRRRPAQRDLVRDGPAPLPRRDLDDPEEPF